MSGHANVDGANHSSSLPGRLFRIVLASIPLGMWSASLFMPAFHIEGIGEFTGLEASGFGSGLSLVPNLLLIIGSLMLISSKRYAGAPIFCGLIALGFAIVTGFVVDEAMGGYWMWLGSILILTVIALSKNARARVILGDLLRN